MGILKTQSTLTIAVWSSILLHTVSFLGFELAFSNRKESFPKSGPRTVTIVSINSVSNPVFSPQPVEENSVQDQILEKSSLQEPVQAKKELSNEITKEITSSELVSDIESTNKQEGKTLFSENSVTSIGSGVAGEEISRTEPVPLKSIEPGYPFRARKKGFEGVVVLNVVVSESGEPVFCLIADSSGYEDLDNAALDTVMSSSYKPGTVNGEEKESTLRIIISFQLNGS